MLVGVIFQCSMLLVRFPFVLLVFALAALLILPIFRLEYFEHWGSAEGPQIAEVRFLRDHWPGPGWNPMFQSGMPDAAVSPPATRFVAALLSRFAGLSPAHAYHVYLGVTWAFGIAGVYALVAVGTGNQLMAAAAALLCAAASPSFLLFPQTYADSWGGVPPRLGVLLRYGDGPHLASLAWLGWMTAMLIRRSYGWASLCGAMVVAHSFQGVLLLLLTLGVLAWSGFTGVRRVGLLSFATPAYFIPAPWWRASWHALPSTVHGGDTWSLWLGLALPIALVLATERSRLRDPWLSFGASAAFLFLAAVAIEYYGGRTLFGDPIRFFPEVDLFVIVVAITILWKLPRRLALGLTALALFPSLLFIRRAWSSQYYPRDVHFERRVENQLQRWVLDHMPQQRVMAGGSTRLWLGLLGDVQQLSAGGEIGSINPVAAAADYQICTGDSPEWAVLWLQALGTGAVMVNDGNSEDVYREFAKPEKFRHLPVLFKNNNGDTIYAAPRRYRALARVVKTDALVNLPEVVTLDQLRAYVRIVEQGPETQPETRWVRPDLLKVEARVEQGQSVVVQATYHRAWKASENGREFRVDRDAVGFMRVDLPPGNHHFDMVYRPGAQRFVYGGVSLAGVAGIVFLLLRGRRG